MAFIDGHVGCFQYCDWSSFGYVEVSRARIDLCESLYLFFWSKFVIDLKDQTMSKAQIARCEANIDRLYSLHEQNITNEVFSKEDISRMNVEIHM
jgi:hypothetical protein